MKGYYHYQECGLRNVYLKNGVVEKDTPYGTATSVIDMGGLHRLLGLELVSNKPGKLSSTEIRFLRIEMDLPQTQLAEVLGVGESSIRAWENNRTKITKSPELLLRTLYKQWADVDSDIRTTVDGLAQLNRTEHHNFLMQSTDDGWQAAA